MDENEPPQLWSTARKWKKISAINCQNKNVLAQFPTTSLEPRVE